MEFTDRKYVEREAGACRFCGEFKNCFVSPNKVVVASHGLKNNKKLEFLRSPSFWSIEKLYWTIEPEYEIKKTEVVVRVCSDCVKGLSKI